MRGQKAIAGSVFGHSPFALVFQLARESSIPVRSLAATDYGLRTTDCRRHVYSDCAVAPQEQFANRSGFRLAGENHRVKWTEQRNWGRQPLATVELRIMSTSMTNLDAATLAQRTLKLGLVTEGQVQEAW